MRKATQLGMVLAAAMVGLLVAGAAAADRGEVNSKNSTAQTLTIDGKTYKVSPRTVFRGYEGQRLTLAQIAVPDTSGGDVERGPVLVEFDSVERRGGHVLLSVTLVEIRD
ncbi:MAG: hypothetical protein MJE66_05035 [Proteobacteria bacterium]|nr:hypothetical protein [Pseudomonadota bacterium]